MLNTERFSRRTAVKALGALGVEILINKPSAVFSADPLLDRFIVAANNMGGVDNLGLRTTRLFKFEGVNHVGYQAAILKEGGNGICLLDTLDVLHDNNLDDVLSSGQLGVYIPKKVSLEKDILANFFGAPLKRSFFEIPQEVNDWTDELLEKGLDIGDPTAFVGDYGSFKVFRFQRQALQVWKDSGKIEKVLIGDAALKTTLVPKESILHRPILDLLEKPEPPAPPPAPAQAAIVEPASTSSSVDQLIAWAASQMGISVSYARSIVNCESRFRSTAMNPSGARGLWQIMPIHADKFTRHGWNYWTDWTDPYKNTIIAIEIAKERGNMSPWDCS